MNKSAKLTIRTETLERWVLHRKRNMDEIAICVQCGSSRWMSLADASTTAGLTHAEICRHEERGVIHSLHTREGHLLICRASLGLLILKEEF